MGYGWLTVTRPNEEGPFFWQTEIVDKTARRSRDKGTEYGRRLVQADRGVWPSERRADRASRPILCQ